MPRTYSEMYIALRNRLRDAGIEAAALEARLIAATAAGKSTEKLLRDMRYYATDEVERRAEEMVQRRLAGEPVAYITGVWEFRGLPMEVSRDVLIPRIDTEVLAELAIKYLRGTGRLDARVLDLCSGTGCIGCAIAAELPRVRVVLADVSAAAMDISRRNVERNGLGGRVSFLPADVTKQPPLMTGSFDLVVSNPPYIPTSELPELPPQVRREPAIALDGGADGLYFYRRLAADSGQLLTPQGLLLIEHGEDQAAEIAAIMSGAGFQQLEVIEDYGHRQRGSLFSRSAAASEISAS